MLRNLFILLLVEDNMNFFLRFLSKGMKINLNLFFMRFEKKLSNMLFGVFLIYFKVNMDIFCNLVVLL